MVVLGGFHPSIANAFLHHLSLQRGYPYSRFSAFLATTSNAKWSSITYEPTKY